MSSVSTGLVNLIFVSDYAKLITRSGQCGLTGEKKTQRGLQGFEEEDQSTAKVLQRLLGVSAAQRCR